jgi:hypothetical protein
MGRLEVRVHLHVGSVMGGLMRPLIRIYDHIHQLRPHKFYCEVQHLGEQRGICYPKWLCQNTMFTLPKPSVSS